MNSFVERDAEADFLTALRTNIRCKWSPSRTCPTFTCDWNEKTAQTDIFALPPIESLSSIGTYKSRERRGEYGRDRAISSWVSGCSGSGTGGRSGSWWGIGFELFWVTLSRYALHRSCFHTWGSGEYCGDIDDA